MRRQQRKAVKREQLRVQEDALRQQIQAYDNLISNKKAELDDAVKVSLPSEGLKAVCSADF